MKKTLSIILSVLMLIMSANITAVFATEDSNLILDVNFATTGITDATGKTLTLSETVPVVSTATGKNGESFTYATFDGTSGNYISVKDSSLLNNPETTVEFWVKPGDLTNKWSRFFTLTNSNSNAASWGAEMDQEYGNCLIPYIKYIENSETKTFIHDPLYYSLEDHRGKWMHITLTRTYDATSDTATMKTYINGKLMQDSASGVLNKNGTIDAADATVYFGACAGNATESNYFVGDIAEIKMYNKELTLAEVKASYKKDMGKFFAENYSDYLLLDVDFSAEGITDATGKTVTLSETAPTVSTATGANGKSFSYATFDGTNGNYIAVNNKELLNNPTTSVEFWVKPQDHTGKSAKFFTLTDKNQANSWGIEMDQVSFYHFIKKSGAAFMPTNGVNGNRNWLDKHYLNANHPSKFGKWTHIIITRNYDAATDSATLKSYINGNLTQEGKALNGSNATIGRGGQIDADNAIAYFGACPGNTGAGNYFVGDIAEIRMYDKEINPYEATQLYQEEAEKFLSYDEAYTIFDMDVSGYNQASAVAEGSYVYNPTLIDKTGNGSKLYVSPQNGGPSKGEFTAYDNSGTVPYLSFAEGNKDQIQFKTDDLYALNNKPQATVEFWIRPTAGKNDWKAIFNMNKWKASWAQNYGTGYLELYSIFSHTSNASLGIKDQLGDQWLHMVLTRDINHEALTADYKIYMNSVLVFEQNNANIDPTKIKSGYVDDSNTNSIIFAPGFVGDIADINMYSNVFDADQVAKKYTETSGLYKEGTVTAPVVLNVDMSTTKDKISGQGFWADSAETKEFNNGLTESSVTYKHFAGDTTGKANSFLNKDSGVVITNTTNRKATSLEMWYRADLEDQTGTQHAFAITPGYKSVDTGATWGLNVRNGKLSVMGNDSTNVIENVAYENATWAHIVLTRELNNQGITYQIYVNGELKGEETLEGATALNDTNAAVLQFAGSYVDADIPCDIAKIKMYSGIVTPAQVKAIYDAEQLSYQWFGSLDVTNVSFTDEIGEPIDTMSDLITNGSEVMVVDVVLKNTHLEAKDYIIYVGLYDANNKLLNIYSAPDSIQSETDGKSSSVEVPVEDITATASYLKVFIWSAEDGEEMKPIGTKEYKISYGGGA